ncbi:hypothetical protein BMETH_399_3 [methanotrophic bacterial endosymbiont of Bathymodiolus sp.]|nr:hypothetical protein BMETH_399_3 [methanotrophic bacterial endosymbiont of Bathymodiolus sp.]
MRVYPLPGFESLPLRHYAFLSYWLFCCYSLPPYKFIYLETYPIHVSHQAILAHDTFFNPPSKKVFIDQHQYIYYLEQW